MPHRRADVARQRDRGDRRDVVRVDPRDPPRTERQHDATACDQRTLTLEHGGEERRLEHGRRHRRRRQPPLDRAVVAVQAGVEAGDRDVRDLHDAFDARGLRRVDRVRLQRHLLLRRRRQEEQGAARPRTRARATPDPTRSASATSSRVDRGCGFGRRTSARTGYRVRGQRARTTRPPRVACRTDHDHRHAPSLAEVALLARARTASRTGHRPRADAARRRSRARCGSSPTRAGARTCRATSRGPPTDGGMWVNPWGIWWDEVRASQIIRLDADGQRSSRASGTSRPRCSCTPSCTGPAPTPRSSCTTIRTTPRCSRRMGEMPRIVHQNACDLRRRARVRRRVRARSKATADGQWLADQVGKASGDPARAPRRDRHRADDRRARATRPRRSSACAASPTTSSRAGREPVEIPAPNSARR